jgi:hypothetical protein
MSLNPIWQLLGASIFTLTFLTLAWCIHDAGREEVDEITRRVD